MSDHLLDDMEHISRCEALDRILSKGAVVTGDLTISVANIDLLYLELRVLLASIEKMHEISKLDAAEIRED